jgi:hypothetical protein
MNKHKILASLKEGKVLSSEEKRQIFSQNDAEITLDKNPNYTAV